MTSPTLNWYTATAAAIGDSIGWTRFGMTLEQAREQVARWMRPHVLENLEAAERETLAMALHVECARNPASPATYDAPPPAQICDPEVKPLGELLGDN